MALSPSSYQLIHRQNQEPDRVREAQAFAEPDHPSKHDAGAFSFQTRDLPDRYFHDCLPWLDAPTGRHIAGRFPPPTKKVA